LIDWERNRRGIALKGREGREEKGKKQRSGKWKSRGGRTGKWRLSADPLLS